MTTATRKPFDPAYVAHFKLLGTTPRGLLARHRGFEIFVGDNLDPEGMSDPAYDCPLQVRGRGGRVYETPGAFTVAQAKKTLDYLWENCPAEYALLNAIQGAEFALISAIQGA